MKKSKRYLLKIGIIIGIFLLIIFLIRLTGNEDSWVCEKGVWVKHGSPLSEMPIESCDGIIGGDRDDHGCIPSAGYSWCEEKQKCLKIWEEYCSELMMEELAKGYCSEENVAGIYVCGDMIKIESDLLGGGATYYQFGKDKIICPVVSPDYESIDCKQIESSNCIEKEVQC